MTSPTDFESGSTNRFTTILFMWWLLTCLLQAQVQRLFAKIRLLLIWTSFYFFMCTVLERAHKNCCMPTGLKLQSVIQRLFQMLQPDYSTDLWFIYLVSGSVKGKNAYWTVHMWKYHTISALHKWHFLSKERPLILSVWLLNPHLHN